MIIGMNDIHTCTSSVFYSTPVFNLKNESKMLIICSTNMQFKYFWYLAMLHFLCLFVMYMYIVNVIDMLHVVWQFVAKLHHIACGDDFFL